MEIKQANDLLTQACKQANASHKAPLRGAQGHLCAVEKGDDS